MSETWFLVQSYHRDTTLRQRICTWARIRYEFILHLYWALITCDSSETSLAPTFRPENDRGRRHFVLLSLNIGAVWVSAFSRTQGAYALSEILTGNSAFSECYIALFGCWIFPVQLISGLSLIFDFFDLPCLVTARRLCLRCFRLFHGWSTELVELFFIVCFR